MDKLDLFKKVLKSLQNILVFITAVMNSSLCVPAHCSNHVEDPSVCGQHQKTHCTKDGADKQSTI